MLYLNRYYAFLIVARYFCNFWVNGQQKKLLTGHLTNDATKREMSRRQRRASAYCWQYFGDLKTINGQRAAGKRANSFLTVETLTPIGTPCVFTMLAERRGVPIALTQFCPCSNLYKYWLSINRTNAHSILNLSWRSG